ncbi:tRNA (guanosine(37)-N1)-methyltransferase TrmD [Alloscardovia macacae]|uniref:tRNA (guanine-N(1)-)-methyltransferase n=1 Tax=Alloscardovia macacae TaxID=1160091 RepID=A0A1Y2SUG4_9BIFI|nr:tRNA (guanosine(37)-N1)-methyltransferase TrmD [Alloscardovia macacae]OTA26618.1 tRNA (guanosine(37)-N1)-methyltransferase TrmD [Alloscardovia macacae]OTA28996.1 tRNA (guanosine(37)-N1)-methyltransferase TrmD [Alloscardovia macacae]
MLIDIVSVFPEYFDVLNLSLLGKAQDKGLLEFRVHNLRDWTHDVHHSVDDTPVGGGAGMVMKPEVWAQCLDDLLDIPPLEDIAQADEQTSEKRGSNAILVFPNPSAPTFTQKDATELSHADHLVFGCGRYEGYDGRLPAYYAAQGFDVREYSIGDYVLNGGEVAVSVMVEATTRLLDGFMGNHDSIVEESYTGSEGLLEHRQYTKPASWRGMDVPEILLSGHHANIDRFRRDEELRRTSAIRPDIIARLDCRALDKKDRKFLMELGWEVSGEHPVRR